MADPNVYEVAHLKDADDILVTLGVDYDLVTISQGRWESGGGIRLTREQAEAFARYCVHACWEAATGSESIAAIYKDVPRGV